MSILVRDLSFEQRLEIRYLFRLFFPTVMMFVCPFGVGC